MEKNIIDDGFHAELVETAFFEGIHEIPIINCPGEIVIPDSLIPFSQIGKSKNYSEFVHFYEHDIRFRDIVTSTNEYIETLKRFRGVISPDCSLYRDMPLVLQITNTYLNKAVGHALQKSGLYVIANVRWGDERSYTSEFCGESFAFLGAPKRSIVSVSTYGCIRSREDKYYFKAGLDAMLKELEPEVVLVHGAMPDSVFRDYLGLAAFYHYPDWISQKKRQVV